MVTSPASTLILQDGSTLPDLCFQFSPPNPSPSHNSDQITHEHDASFPSMGGSMGSSMGGSMGEGIGSSMGDSTVPHYTLTHPTPILLSKIPLYISISPPGSGALNLVPDTSAEKWLKKAIFDAGMALIKDGGGVLNEAVREVGVLARVLGQSRGIGTGTGVAEEHGDEIGDGDGNGDGRREMEDVWPATEVVFFKPAPGSDGAGGAGGGETCNVKAMALSSHLLYAAASLPSPPRSPASEDEDADKDADENGDRDIEARFLELPLKPLKSMPPPPTQADDAADGELVGMATLKRNSQDIDQLFESAAERRKKARRKGGGGVGFAASRGSKPSNNLKGPSSNSNSSSTVNVLQGRHRRRSSLQAMQSSHSQQQPDSRQTAATRPSCRAGPPRQRSSLSRMTSADELPLENEASINERNRSAISKTVMAGMRIFGLHRSATYASDSQQRGLSFEEGQSAGDGGTSEDEYKLVYHQTFKGTVFAFRRELEKEVLKPDAVREVVDRLLGVFCGEAG